MEAGLVKKCLKTSFKNHIRSLNLDEPKIDSKVCLDRLNNDGDGLRVLCLPHK